MRSTTKKGIRQKTKFASGILLAAQLMFGPQTVLASELTPDSKSQFAPMSNIELPTYQHGSASLADYRGKVVLVDFWASWCSPCRTSFPWMNQMQAKYQSQGFEVVAINLDQEKSQADKFLTQIPPKFTVLFDENAQLPEAFEVIGMPTSFLLDRSGKIRTTHIGFHEDQKDDYEKQIQALLKEGANG